MCSAYIFTSQEQQSGALEWVRHHISDKGWPYEKAKALGDAAAQAASAALGAYGGKAYDGGGAPTVVLSLEVTERDAELEIIHEGRALDSAAYGGFKLNRVETLRDEHGAQVMALACQREG